ncbi:MAG: PrgI family protein [Clostridia bacterium]|nr:PrgI family protein [Clostridia bacterium]
MQQFTVPQFIDVESKIIGPITTRQFLILVVAAIIIGISYKIFDFTSFLVIGFLVLVISVVFAFAKVNGRNFHLFLLNVVQNLRKPNLRVWNHKIETNYQEDKEVIIKREDQAPIKTVYHSSRLAELSLVVDTQGRYRGEDYEE